MSFSGGYITGGTGTGTDGYFYGQGGGIWVRIGNCEMTGGTIIGCNARFGGGVGVYSGKFTMSGGCICYCESGVCLRSGSDEYYASGYAHPTVAYMDMFGG